MGTILVATDFSQVAKNATDYAVELAKHTGDSLLLLHCYQLAFADESTLISIQEFEALKEVAEKGMAKEIARVAAEAGKVNVETRVFPGDLLANIREIAAELTVSFVVMGNSNAEDSLLWGSVSLSAMRELSLPVLAIPAEKKWEPVKAICFAADYSDSELKLPVEDLGALLKKFGAKLFVLHVDKPGYQAEVPENFRESFAPIDPVYISIENAEVEPGIQEFLNNHVIDWLVIMPHRHNFFQRLFGAGNTAKLAHISTHPILTVHEG